MELLKTPLFNFHLENGARMMPFAGWNMPVQYSSGIIAEHLATRTSASLFDVSHMAQLELLGSCADVFLERLTPTNVTGLAEGQMRYSFFLNNDGGIIDDFLISRLNDSLRLVVNASRSRQDIEHLNRHLNGDVKLNHRTDKALIALQGPKSASILARLGLNLNELNFMHIRNCKIDQIPVAIARSGYTGEDGFEISTDVESVESLARQLLSFNEVSLAGLGARDTLRIEAGLPLWGNEINEDISPISAGLAFALSKKRCELADFIGSKKILFESKNMPKKILVGLMAEGARPVRGGAELKHKGKKIGHITSGTFSPSLDRPIAIAFVKSRHSRLGTRLVAEIRGSEIQTEVVARHFPHKYYRGCSSQI